ncbi:signal peptidase II [Glycomyces buryatensis]|uniref:Lipoprotein signal peptidase n=1 Tax=Glycomyces buryatensis TaxID=2570927 RepID=A0A4S8Q9U6_9ACTN|nr:signal peptidase II [Glycomyces buryatensis]
MPDTDPTDRTPVQERPRRRGLVLAAYLIAAFAIVLDQVVKAWAVNNLDPDDPERILGGLVYLSLTWNPGAAFSIATDYTWVLAIIATAVVVFLIVLARKILYPAWSIAIGLVLGGAAGNLIDRFFRSPSDVSSPLDGNLGQGHVVDYISVFQPYGEVFAIFNLADSALCCGVVLIVLLELTGHGFSPESRRPKSEQSE